MQRRLIGLKRDVSRGLGTLGTKVIKVWFLSIIMHKQLSHKTKQVYPTFGLNFLSHLCNLRFYITLFVFRIMCSYLVLPLFVIGFIFSEFWFILCASILIFCKISSDSCCNLWSRFHHFIVSLFSLLDWIELFSPI